MTERALDVIASAPEESADDVRPPADAGANASSRPRTSRRRRRWLHPTLVALLAAGVLVGLFDATWLRPLIQHHIAERSGRRIAFDEMHAGLDASFEPVLTFRNLDIQNAPWASTTRPLVHAANLRMHFRWSSLWGDRIIITRVEMTDAEIDLERQADGLRNWRLTRPDDRGPGRVRVMSVDAQRSVARVVVQAAALELELRSSPLAAPLSSGVHPELPLTRALSLSGTRAGTAFSGEVAVGSELTFFDTGRDVGVRGTVRVGRSMAWIDGSARDLFESAGLDADVRVRGDDTDELMALLGSGARLPALPIAATARVRKSGPRWTVDGLRASAGNSTLTGTVQWIARDAAHPRARLDVTADAARLDLKPWLARAGGREVRPADPAAWVRGLDARIDLSAARIDGTPLAALQAMRLHATVHDDELAASIAPTAFAGGHVGGALFVGARQAPVNLGLDLRVDGVQLERLISRTASDVTARGRIHGHVVLGARGASVRDLVASSGGSVRGSLVRGSLPRSLEAKLGLDGGRWLRSLFGRDERSAITCSALWLQVDQGRARVRQLAFETDAVALAGTGEADLGRRTVDLVLTPQRKGFTLIGLDKSMRIEGPLHGTHVTLIDRVEMPPGDRCAVPAGTPPTHRDAANARAATR